MSGLLPLLDPTGQRCLAGGPLGQPRLRNAVARTPSENEPLCQLLTGRQALGGLHGQRPAPDRGAPACERLDVAPAHVADEATRAGTGSEVLADAPVTEVVARPMAGPRIVGNLVVLEAALARRVHEGPVLSDHGILVRQILHATGAPGTPTVQRQRISRDVIRLPVQYALDARRPRIDRQPGQAIHEVDADIVVARLAGRVERRARAACVMQPAEPRQHRVVQRLHTKADASDPRGAVTREPLARDALGIALDRDLGVRSEPPARAEVFQHRRERAGLEQRRRTAAEENGADGDLARPAERAEQVELGMQRAQIRVHLARFERRGVERAVVAALNAERNMEIKTESGRPWNGAGNYLGQATHGLIRARGPRYNEPRGPGYGIYLASLHQRSQCRSLSQDQ